jgi:hypothetical protein
MSEMISSLDFPAPAADLGSKDKMVSSKAEVSFWALVISAFSCNPKASGKGIKGKLEM